MKNIFFIIVLFYNLITPYSAHAESLEQKSNTLIKEAKTTNKTAIKLNNEWRDVRKLIKQATKAHAEKKYEKSINLASQALNQAQMSIEQHNKQKDNYRFLDD